jgi:hypothetical protein
MSEYQIMLLQTLVKEFNKHIMVYCRMCLLIIGYRWIYYFKKKFEDTKGVIRSHKPMKDRLENGHTKKEQKGQEMIYKHYTET